jgi:hypothetical protein
MERAAAAGRAAGLHLLLCGQFREPHYARKVFTEAARQA